MMTRIYDDPQMQERKVERIKESIWEWVLARMTLDNQPFTLRRWFTALQMAQQMWNATQCLSRYYSSIIDPRDALTNINICIQ